MDLITILPNLSIGVVAVLSLVYVTRMFVTKMDERAMRYDTTMLERGTRHEAAMLEREQALREVETEIRHTLREHISQSNLALAENTKALLDNADANRRVAEIIDRKLSL